MKTKIFRTRDIVLLIVLITLTWTISGCQNTGIQGGAAECEITPPVGYEIQHYYRHSIGVNDPLFARCLYLEDSKSNSLAIVCLDLISGTFPACDELRKRIQEETGIENSLISFSHSHATVTLGSRGQTEISNDTNSRWNDQTLDAILAIVQEAKKGAEPISLRAGRAPAQIGVNRRKRNGPVVPWVNVLVADSKKTGKPMAVLFEHAAHPVIVPHTSKLTSADYPGAAVKHVREVLGNDVIALFGQGCCGNINGYPLRSTHEKADEAGQNLGDAVLQAIENSDPIESNTFSVKFAQTMLPSTPLPSEEEFAKMVSQSKENLEQIEQLYKFYGRLNMWPDGELTSEKRTNQLNSIRDLLDRGEKPPPRRFDVYAVMFGHEWCLTTMPHEMFSQYELWIDENAPFKHTMTFAYTNGDEGYIPMDEDLKMGAKGGYEAARLPNWRGQVWGPQHGPPAVGCEKIIKENIASLWAQDESANKQYED